MTEIKHQPITILSGSAWTNDSDEPAMVFTANHTHRDILRYVIADLGDETLFHVQDILGESA